MTQILLTITPDPDGVHCGECRWGRPGMSTLPLHRACGLFDFTLCRVPDGDNVERCTACLTAERAASDLVTSAQTARAEASAALAEAAGQIARGDLG